MRKSPILLLCLLAGLLFVGTAHAQSNAFTSLTVRVTGIKQGWIKGGIAIRTRENLIQGLSFKVVSNRTFTNNLAISSTLQLGLVEFTKPLDKATPLLQKALGENEMLTKVEFTFYGSRLGTASGAAPETVLYTVVLTNARIAAIQDVYTPSSTTNQNNFQQTIGLTYEKIEWTWMDGGVTHSETNGSGR